MAAQCAAMMPFFSISNLSRVTLSGVAEKIRRNNPILRVRRHTVPGWHGAVWAMNASAIKRRDANSIDNAGRSSRHDEKDARIAELEQKLQRSRSTVHDLQTQLAEFAKASGGWFWETDEEHRFAYISESVVAATGVPAEWHYGKTREEIGVPRMLKEGAWEAHRRNLQNREPFSGFVFRREVPNGERWMRTSGVPKFDKDQRFIGYRGTAQDVTAEIIERERAERLTNAIQGLDELFVLWDADDRLVVCNRRFREINVKVIETTEPGTLFEDHIRTALEAGLYPQAAGREEEWFNERIRHHRNPGLPFEIKRQNGRWLLLSEQKLSDGSTVTRSNDITEQKRMEESLRRLAMQDPLTEVFNHRAFMEIAEAALAAPGTVDLPVGLVIFDVDHFKSVNDRFGHMIGDEALRFVANTARDAIGGECSIGRVGGEEFSVLLPGHNVEATKLVAERIRRTIETALVPDVDCSLRLTVSVGALSVAEPAELDAAMRAADKLLYQAKSEGRNRIVHDVFRPV